jgi:hypothetical protein
MKVTLSIARPDVELGYSDKRLGEYPLIRDQLDMLWHSMDRGEIPKSPEFYGAIKSVKEKHPKDE